MADRDSGIAGIEPTPIVFPTPDIPSEKASFPPNPTYNKSTKQPNEKSSFTKGRERVKTLSNTPPSTLVKLLLHEESTTRKTRQLLTQAVDRLGTASERAVNAETSRRAVEVSALLEKAKRDQELAIASDEASRARNELAMYKLHLKKAQDEVTRAHKAMKALTERQVAAERNAAQARSLARKYRGQNLTMIAKEEGKLEGYRQGLRIGRQVIGAKYDEHDIQDGGSAYIEEYFEDTEGTATAHSTPHSQSRRASRKDDGRRRRDSEAHTPRQTTVDGYPRSTPRPQPEPTLPASSNRIASPLAATVQGVDSPQPGPSLLPPPSIHAQQPSLVSPHIHQRHSQQITSEEEPEVINIRTSVTTDSTPTQARESSDLPRSPAESSNSRPPVQIFPHPSPSQASHTASPISENSALGILEYVPMPPPPISMPPPELQIPAQRSPEIQAPVPGSGVQNSEADRQREVDASTPSTITGIAGLATFPSYVPTVSSSDGADVGGRAPGVAGSTSGSLTGVNRPPSAAGSRAGSVRSVGSGDPWQGSSGRRGNLSTIYEQSREGTPGLTPMHTGTSSVQSQVRVDEWRKSLSQSGTESPRSDVKPLSPMLSGSSLYAPPPPSLVSQDTGLTDLRRRRSSSSGKTASINIQVEPPSQPASDGRHTPVPGSAGSRGHSAPQYPTFGSGGSTHHSTGPQQQQPGYLSPNRSPLDLASIQSTESGPNEPPVIPGMTPKHPGVSRNPGPPPMVSGPLNNGSSPGAQAPLPHIYATGQFPPGFVPAYVQPSPDARTMSLQNSRRPTSPVDSDQSEEESTTSSRRNLMNTLYGGNGASDIPPGAVTGGTPQVTWKSSTATGSSYETWPPNPPPIGSASFSTSPNPLPKPPQPISGGTTFGAWGSGSPYAPSPSGSGNPPYTLRGTTGESERSRSPAPVPIPNPTLNNNWGAIPKTSSTSTSNTTPRFAGVTPRSLGTPRLGMISPSLVSSLDRALPLDNTIDASPRTKRESLHAGTTPLFKGKSIPSLSGSGSGRSSRNGSEEYNVLETQTQENTVANAKTVRMGDRVQVGAAGSSPYRQQANVPLYRQ
ncbi:hypothetical protein E1B28_011399 [Marasmius oreades]|uniref:Uncharacterized protein n=1 Tax=Marasmius oreades TaxID=181124 RepID=A0A9P7RU63_9AGAR|nr:uncharacterized protein E1B28_011399 [Marasmius oreades]KAG7089745.1 hypothetical protein E1B28_011399 [Marasmius oreades]